MRISDEDFLNMYSGTNNLVGVQEEPTDALEEKEPINAGVWRSIQAMAERGSEIFGYNAPLNKPLNRDFPLENHVPDHYWEQRDRYLDADSVEDVAEITSRLDRELENKQIIEEAGWYGAIGEAAFGLVSPTTFISGLGIVKSATKLGMIGKTALASSAVVAGSIGVQEYILQQQQSFRPIEESVGAVVGAAVLGGAFGAGVSAFIGRTEKEVLGEMIGKIVTKEKLDVQVNDLGEITSVSSKSVGAAETDEAIKHVNMLLDMQKEGLANISEGAVKVLSMHGLGLAGPNIMSKVSKSLSTKKLGNSFFDNSGLILGKNLDGIATESSADIAIHMYNDKLAKMSKNIELEELYSYKEKGLGDYKQLSEDVQDAILSGKSKNEYVESIVSKLKSEQVRLAKELQAIDKLDKNIDVTKTDYLTGKWDPIKVAANRDSVISRFIADFTKHAEKQLSDVGIDVKIDDATNIHDLIDGKITSLKQVGGNEEAITKLKSVKEDLHETLGDIKESASRSVSKLSGDEPFNELTNIHKNMSNPKFTKERRLTVDHKDYQDVMNRDAIGNIFNYLHTANRVIELDKMFKNAGFKDAADYLNAVKADVNEMAKLDPKVAKNLDKILEKELSLAQDILDIANGNILRKNGTGKAFQYMRKYQTLTLLGGVTISSLPDLAMPIFKHGMSRTIADGYAPLIRSLSTAKMAREELQDFGVANELMTNSIYKSLQGDPSEFAFAMSKKNTAERWIDDSMNFFGKVSGMTYWNNFFQGMAGQMSIARTTRAVKALVEGKISKKEHNRLLSLGIGDNTAKSIWSNFLEYGEEYGGSFITNHKQWDTATRDLLGQSVYRDVYSTILRPSAGDIPLAMQKYESMKTIMQFKSFVAAATNKILISGIQRRDAQVLQGFIALNMLGALSHNIKLLISGKDVETDPFEAMKQGAFKAGWPGWIGEATTLVPGMGYSRFGSGDFSAKTMGPTFNHAAAVYDIGKSIVGGNGLSSADERTIRRSIPFNNLFYIKALIDNVNWD